MRLLKALTAASVIGGWLVIVVGGYVSHTGSGLGCPEFVTCGDPVDPGAAAIEGAHRLVAWSEGFILLALLVLVLLRYRHWPEVRNLTVLGFVMIVVQSTLGILAVATDLSPVVVTTHLGVATAFLAVMVLNAAFVFRGTPPEPVRTEGSRPAAADS